MSDLDGFQDQRAQCIMTNIDHSIDAALVLS